MDGGLRVCGREGGGGLDARGNVITQFSMACLPYLLPPQGLAYLHALNITHGDLKPANVLLKSSRLDRRGFTTRISDFGFAAVNGGRGKLSVKGGQG